MQRIFDGGIEDDMGNVFWSPDVREVFPNEKLIVNGRCVEPKELIE